MGACLSTIAGGGEMLIEAPDGDDKAFHDRFMEGDVLGEGEFGQVKKVFETSSPEVALACKTLKKGMVFKDNQLYPALPPEMLKGEIEILRALKGKHTFCLQLHSVFESPRAILLVTELCAGGEMSEYVAKQQDDLRTEDVSRISHQLLTAIDCCAKKRIIHRDLKPANIMFETGDSKSDLRVIDFGASCMDPPTSDGRHTTFAGTAFFNSPEMFQEKYTQKTDVFSVGVTLYVLVAGYPADQLQKAFNILQKGATKSNIKLLPNMPQNMPESYYDMLAGLLVWQPKDRKTAAEMLTHPFVTFHNDLTSEEKEEQAPAPTVATALETKRPSMFKRQSIVLTGTAQRHNLTLGYQKFERSLTTLLATMLQQEELQRLVELVTQAQNELRDGSETTGVSVGSLSEQIESKAGSLGTLPLHQVLKIVQVELEKEEV